MGQEFWRAIQTGPFPLGHRNAELFCVPIDDDGRQQIQPGDAEVLAFACAVSDLALTSNPQGSLQCMMRLALIEAAICAALHVGVEKPFDDEGFCCKDFDVGCFSGEIFAYACEF